MILIILHLLGSKTVTLTAHNAGTATIKVTADDVSDSNFNEVEGTRSVTITVTEPAPPPPPPTPTTPSGGNGGGGYTASSDATLKSITIGGKVYSNPSTDFTITLGADVNSVNVSAVTNNGAARVSGTGTRELVTGTNNVKLTVTAENGATKNYSIIIRKLADGTTTPNVPDDQANNEGIDPQQEPNQVPENLRLSYLSIEDVELIPDFDSEVFEYTIFVTNRDSVDVIASANIEDAVVEITGDKELVDGDNEIIIKLTKDDQEVVYKIMANKTTVAMTDEQEEGHDEEEEQGFWTSKKIIIAVITAAAVIAVVGFGIWKVKANSDPYTGARRTKSKSSSYDDFND